MGWQQVFLRLNRQKVALGSSKCGQRCIYATFKLFETKNAHISWDFITPVHECVETRGKEKKPQEFPVTLKITLLFVANKHRLYKWSKQQSNLCDFSKTKGHFAFREHLESWWRLRYYHHHYTFWAALINIFKFKLTEWLYVMWKMLILTNPLRIITQLCSPPQLYGAFSSSFWF